MRERQPVTFLLTRGESSLIDWAQIAAEHCLIRISNAPLFFAAFEYESRNGDREIARVIFDQSIRSDSYLEFLATLPAEFRGDVLLIRRRGSSFLSSCSRTDGRFLYHLTPEDVRFYVSTILPERPAVLPVEASHDLAARENEPEPGPNDPGRPKTYFRTTKSKSIQGIAPFPAFAELIEKQDAKPELSIQIR